MHEFHEEEEAYFCQFTFGQFVSLALLEVVALFFAFYLGSRYGPALWGKQVEPVPDHLAMVEELPAAALPSSSAEVRYTFPEELTRKPDRIVIERPAPAPQPTVAVKPKPTLRTPPAPQPVSQAQPVGESRSGYSIQVGSFRKASGAAEKVNLWQSRGYDAFLSIGEVAGSGTWYRVRIRNFQSRDSARRFLDQLSTRENTKGIIVRSSS